MSKAARVGPADLVSGPPPHPEGRASGGQTPSDATAVGGMTKVMGPENRNALLLV